MNAERDAEQNGQVAGLGDEWCTGCQGYSRVWRAGWYEDEKGQVCIGRWCGVCGTGGYTPVNDCRLTNEA